MCARRAWTCGAARRRNQEKCSLPIERVAVDSGVRRVAQVGRSRDVADDGPNGFEKRFENIHRNVFETLYFRKARRSSLKAQGWRDAGPPRGGCAGGAAPGVWEVSSAGAAPCRSESGFGGSCSRPFRHWFQRELLPAVLLLIVRLLCPWIVVCPLVVSESRVSCVVCVVACGSCSRRVERVLAGAAPCLLDRETSELAWWPLRGERGGGKKRAFNDIITAVVVSAETWF